MTECTAHVPRVSPDCNAKSNTSRVDETITLVSMGVHVSRNVRPTLEKYFTDANATSRTVSWMLHTPENIASTLRQFFVREEMDSTTDRHFVRTAANVRTETQTRTKSKYSKFLPRRASLGRKPIKRTSKSRYARIIC